MYKHEVVEGAGKGGETVWTQGLQTLNRIISLFYSWAVFTISICGLGRIDFDFFFENHKTEVTFFRLLHNYAN